MLLHTCASFAQCPTGLEPGTNNIIINGDFSAGNTDFTSEYSYCNIADCLNPEATYSVGTDPSFYHSGWEGADHTTGNGNFLIANGAGTAGTKVWCQNVTITPSSYYQLSFWVTSVFAGSPASIQFYINGSPLLSPISAPAGINTWVQFNQVFQSGLIENAEICLVNLNTGVNGNDFGIDDISLKKCECAMTINAGPDTSMCYGDTVQLDGSGAIAYVWSPPGGLSCTFCEDPLASPSETTTYYVSLNGPAGCIAIDSAVVTVFPPLDLHARPDDTTICFGETVQLHADGAITYQWSSSGGISGADSPDPIASPDDTATYYLHAVDAHGCDQYDSLTVNVFTKSENIVATGDTVICFGKEALLHVTGAEFYSWFPSQNLTCADCEFTVASPLATTVFTVTGIDSNGCSAGSDTVRVEIDEGCSHFDIPTAFSPNNDGKNDFFRAISKGVVSFDLKIFNRWGELVFAATNPDSVWDGKANDADQPVGVYVWMLKGTLDDGTILDRNGNVTLVR